jgi:hypothetical protein
MGRILTLNPPYNGMSAIVNVLARVGPGETNNTEDVKVVQRLMQMGARGKAPAASIGVPQVTGHFDAATGFWIYHAQRLYRNLTVDGIVSPAHGAHYAPGGSIWAIVIFNDIAKSTCPQDYAAFMAQSAT